MWRWTHTLIFGILPQYSLDQTSCLVIAVYGGGNTGNITILLQCSATRQGAVLLFACSLPVRAGRAMRCAVALVEGEKWLWCICQETAEQCGGVAAFNRGEFVRGETACP